MCHFGVPQNLAQKLRRISASAFLLGCPVFSFRGVLGFVGGPDHIFRSPLALFCLYHNHRYGHRHHRRLRAHRHQSLSAARVLKVSIWFHHRVPVFHITDVHEDLHSRDLRSHRAIHPRRKRYHCILERIYSGPMRLPAGQADLGFRRQGIARRLSLCCGLPYPGRQQCVYPSRTGPATVPEDIDVLATEDLCQE